MLADYVALNVNFNKILTFQVYIPILIFDVHPVYARLYVVAFIVVFVISFAPFGKFKAIVAAKVAIFKAEPYSQL